MGSKTGGGREQYGLICLTARVVVAEFFPEITLMR